jgi:hypothetical protein
MEILSYNQVKDIIELGRSESAITIMGMLDKMEVKHPSIYRVIYGEPSDAIASINRDMANLYIDLSCDVIWFFIKAFGEPPTIENEEKWTQSHLSLIDFELKSLSDEISMNEKIRSNLNERFANRSVEASVQIELIKHLEGEVDKYTSFKESRLSASVLTKNLLFVLVRLMGDLYHAKK